MLPFQFQFRHTTLFVVFLRYGTLSHTAAPYVAGNLFEDVAVAARLDDRGLTWQRQYVAPGGLFDQQLR